jgi:sialate O-acetylesterase
VFSQLIQCWRDLWDDNLPFLFVQLAPFGRWLDIDGEAFPTIREQQQTVARTVDQTWMASSSDAGMEMDIHPKRKKPIGKRLALLALEHIYNQPVLSEPPECVGAERFQGGIHLRFSHADGLYVDGDTIHALSIEGQNGEKLGYERAHIDNDTLVLEGQFEQSMTIKFAMTPYYEVNLYNSVGNPAQPFVVTV